MSVCTDIIRRELDRIAKEAATLKTENERLKECLRLIQSGKEIIDVSRLDKNGGVYYDIREVK